MTDGPVRIRQTHVYERGDLLLLRWAHQTAKEGFPFASEEVDVARVPVDARELGEMILAALAKCSFVWETIPYEAKDKMTPLLAASGAKTWSKFMDGARYVHVVEQLDGMLRLQPMANLGARKGFYANQGDDPPTILDGPDAEELGSTVLTLLRHFDGQGDGS